MHYKYGYESTPVFNRFLMSAPSLEAAKAAATTANAAADVAEASRLRALCESPIFAEVALDALTSESGADAVRQLLSIVGDGTVALRARFDVLKCLYMLYTHLDKPGVVTTQVFVDLLFGLETPRLLQLEASRLWKCVMRVASTAAYCSAARTIFDDTLVQCFTDAAGGDQAAAERAVHFFAAITDRRRELGQESPFAGVFIYGTPVLKAAVQAISTTPASLAKHPMALIAQACQCAPTDIFMHGAIPALVARLSSDDDEPETRLYVLEALVALSSSDRGQDLLLAVPDAVALLTATLGGASVEATRLVAAILSHLAFSAEVREAIQSVGDNEAAGDTTALVEACARSPFVGEVMVESTKGYLAIIEHVELKELAVAACANAQRGSTAACTILSALADKGSTADRDVLLSLGPCAVLVEVLRENVEVHDGWRAVLALLKCAEGVVAQALEQTELLAVVANGLDHGGDAAFHAIQIIGHMAQNAGSEVVSKALEDSGVVKGLLKHVESWFAAEPNFPADTADNDRRHDVRSLARAAIGCLSSLANASQLPTVRGTISDAASAVFTEYVQRREAEVRKEVMGLLGGLASCNTQLDQQMAGMFEAVVDGAAPRLSDYETLERMMTGGFKAPQLYKLIKERRPKFPRQLIVALETAAVSAEEDCHVLVDLITSLGRQVDERWALVTALIPLLQIEREDPSLSQKTARCLLNLISGWATTNAAMPALPALIAQLGSVQPGRAGLFTRLLSHLCAQAKESGEKESDEMRAAMNKAGAVDALVRLVDADLGCELEDTCDACNALGDLTGAAEVDAEFGRLAAACSLKLVCTMAQAGQLQRHSDQSAPIAAKLAEAVSRLGTLSKDELAATRGAFHTLAADPDAIALILPLVQELVSFVVSNMGAREEAFRSAAQCIGAIAQQGTSECMQTLLEASIFDSLGRLLRDADMADASFMAVLTAGLQDPATAEASEAVIKQILEANMPEQANQLVAADARFGVDAIGYVRSEVGKRALARHRVIPRLIATLSGDKWSLLRGHAQSASTSLDGVLINNAEMLKVALECDAAKTLIDGIGRSASVGINPDMFLRPLLSFCDAPEHEYRDALLQSDLILKAMEPIVAAGRTADGFGTCDFIIDLLLQWGNKAHVDQIGLSRCIELLLGHPKSEEIGGATNRVIAHFAKRLPAAGKKLRQAIDDLSSGDAVASERALNRLCDMSDGAEGASIVLDSEASSNDPGAPHPVLVTLVEALHDKNRMHLHWTIHSVLYALARALPKRVASVFVIKGIAKELRKHLDSDQQQGATSEARLLCQLAAHSSVARATISATVQRVFEEDDDEVCILPLSPDALTCYL